MSGNPFSILSIDLVTFIILEVNMRRIYAITITSKKYLNNLISDMKVNLIEEIRSLFDQSKTWLKLEVEYFKLTAAEKITLLVGSLIIGFVALLLGAIVLIMLSFALAEVFKLFMNSALAYLSTAGAICILLGLFFIFRRPLLMNPIARLITRVFFDKNH